MERNYNYKKMSYKENRNLKGSVFAIKKMTKEIERHPENKKLLSTVVSSIIKERRIMDFKIVHLTRKAFEDDNLKSKFHLNEGVMNETLYGKAKFFFAVESNDGDILLRDNQCFTYSKEGVTYSKIISLDEWNELILFIVDNRIPFTKGEKKLFKKFFE